MIPEIRAFRTQVVTKNERERIYLSSLDRNLINHALTVLQEYTPRIDSEVTLNIRQVKQIGGEYRVNIRELLPRAVARYYDGSFAVKDEYSIHPRLYHNCHGTALVCAGVTPMVSNSYASFRSHDLKEVPLNEVQAGDIVHLNGGDHSFVFLSHELCLSKNGRTCEKQLKLQFTRDVLKVYDFPEDCLEQEIKIEGKSVQVYRKSDSVNLLEPILDDLLKVPVLYEKAFKHVFTWESEEAAKMEEILAKLEAHVAKVLKQPEISLSKRADLLYVLSQFNNLVAQCRKVDFSQPEPVVVEKTLTRQEPCLTANSVLIALLGLYFVYLQMSIGVKTDPNL